MHGVVAIVCPDWAGGYLAASPRNNHLGLALELLYNKRILVAFEQPTMKLVEYLPMRLIASTHSYG